MNNEKSPTDTPNQSGRASRERKYAPSEAVRLEIEILSGASRKQREEDGSEPANDTSERNPAGDTQSHDE